VGFVDSHALKLRNGFRPTQVDAEITMANRARGSQTRAPDPLASPTQPAAVSGRPNPMSTVSMMSIEKPPPVVGLRWVG
jgi:hypothetical protein